MLILASKSPRRHALLKEMGMEFTVVPSHYNERHDISNDPYELALLHACAKAEDVYARSKKRKDDTVLGADTLVFLDGEIFGKPRSRNEAGKMLKKLSGKTHQVLSAICLIRIADGKTLTHTECTEVQFKKLSADAVEKYLSTDEWKDKAGAYAIQGVAGEFVKTVHGDFSNVIGLPMNALRKLLSSFAPKKNCARMRRKK